MFDAKWVILGACLILLLAWIAWPFVNVLIFAVFFYYVTRPIKRRLKPYIKNETLLVLVSLLLLGLPLVIILGYTLLLAISQINVLVQQISGQSLQPGPLENMSSVISGAWSQLSPGTMAYKDIQTQVAEWYHGAASLLKSTEDIRGFIRATGLTLVDILFKAFLTLIIAFYLLRDDDKLKSWFKSTFPRMVSERDGMLSRYYNAVDRDLEEIFFANIVSIVMIGAIASIVYSILNLFAPDPTFMIPFPILMGILLGIAALLPLVGPWTVDIPLLLYIMARALMAGTFFDHLSFYIIMVISIFLFVENLPNYILRPFISHGRVNTGLLMLAYILGPLVFGISGLFIAVIVLVLLTYYFRIIAPELTKDAPPS